MTETLEKKDTFFHISCFGKLYGDEDSLVPGLEGVFWTVCEDLPHYSANVIFEEPKRVFIEASLKNVCFEDLLFRKICNHFTFCQFVLIGWKTWKSDKVEFEKLNLLREMEATK
jgi:hypothetical protein